MLFLTVIFKAQTKSTQIKQWNCIKLESYCLTNEAINKVKTQPMEWESTCANHVTDKGLISKIYKEHIKVNS